MGAFLDETGNGNPMVVMARAANNSLDRSLVSADGTPLDVKTKFANFDTAAVVALVPAVAGKRIRVLGYSISLNGGAVNAAFYSAANAISSNKSASESRESRPGTYLFQTAVGEALGVGLDAAEEVGVDVIYVEY